MRVGHEVLDGDAGLQGSHLLQLPKAVVGGPDAEAVEQRPVHGHTHAGRLVVDARFGALRAVAQRRAATVVPRAGVARLEVHRGQHAGIGGRGVVVADAFFVADDAHVVVAFESDLQAAAQRQRFVLGEVPHRFGTWVCRGLGQCCGPESRQEYGQKEVFHACCFFDLPGPVGRDVAVDGRDDVRASAASRPPCRPRRPHPWPRVRRHPRPKPRPAAACPARSRRWSSESGADAAGPPRRWRAACRCRPPASGWRTRRSGCRSWPPDRSA